MRIRPKQTPQGAVSWPSRINVLTEFSALGGARASGRVHSAQKLIALGSLTALLVVSLAACTGGSSSGNGTSTSTAFTAVGVEATYEEGVRAHRAGDLVLAEQRFREAIQLNARYLGAYLALAEVLMDDGRPAEALELYDEALVIRERSGDAHLGRALALMELGQAEEAISAADSAAEHGLELEATQVYALGHVALGEYDQAISMLQEILSQTPERTDLRLVLADLLIGQLRYREAIPVLERGAAVERDDMELWTALADVFQSMELWDRSIETWERINTLNPHNPYVLMRLGEAHWMTGNHMLAIQALDDSVQGDPTQVHARILRGNALVAAGFLDRAMNDCEESLRQDPNNLEALTLLGAIHVERGDLDAAIDAYNGIVAANPGNVAPAIALARLYIDHEQPQEAVGTLQPFESEAGSNPELTETLFSVHRAAGNVDQALEYLVSYVSGHEDDPVLLLEVVETALQLPDQTFISSAQLVNYAERAFDLSGGFRVEYRVALIDTLVMDGQIEQAVVETEQGLEEIPGNPDLRDRQRQLSGQ